MNKCNKCEYDLNNYIEDYNYKMCKECVRNNIKVCTCNKTFITGIPDTIKIEDDYYNIPEELPEYFFKQIFGKMYGIEGCKGCKHTGLISIKNNFETALRASIYSCVYQKIKDNHHEDFFYEYVSDALNPVFDDYLKKNGIKVGEEMELPVTTKN